MPKIKLAPTPLSTDDYDELLRVIRSADEPLEAAKVTKVAMTSRRPTSDETAAILQKFVAEGAVKVWPAKTTKGKPRYWDRDLKSVGQTALEELVHQSADPVTAKEVKTRCKLPFKLSDSDIALILNDLAKSGVIFEIPAKTAKSGVRYWKHDAVEFGRRSLLRLISDQPPQAKAKLKGAVKWLDQAQFEDLVEQLKGRGDIFCHPPIGKSTQPLWSRSPPVPEPYLKSIRDQLATVVAQLKSASVSPADLRRAAVQMFESVGISFGAAAPSTGQLDSGHREEAADLLKLMQQLDPGADRGALVPARVLREAAKMPKAEFDALVLQLSRQGKIALHEHDFVASLRPEDRDELVTDGRGTFYVGMALRRAQGES